MIAVAGGSSDTVANPALLYAQTWLTILPLPSDGRGPGVVS
jgi:hypothetical protein